MRPPQYIRSVRVINRTTEGFRLEILFQGSERFRRERFEAAVRAYENAEYTFERPDRDAVFVIPIACVSLTRLCRTLVTVCDTDQPGVTELVLVIGPSPVPVDGDGKTVVHIDPTSATILLRPAEHR